MARAAGIRGYRKNVGTLPGKPDLVFTRAKLAIFVHGCYWHSCPKCIGERIPKTNRAYWSAKLAANRDRDSRKEAELTSRGFRVITLWECELKCELQLAVKQIRAALSPLA